MFFFQPIEQFQIIPLVNLGNYITIITNELFFLLMMLIYLVVFFISLLNISGSKGLFMIPINYQSIFELIHKMIIMLLKENFKNKNYSSFFPFIVTIFIFILAINLMGLIPYSFTATSHLMLTLTLSLSSFIGINILSIKKYGIEFFSLFMPAGTNLMLAFLLVPIELISYLVKPISLSIRLFANLMAGHTLLKVVAGFAFSLMTLGGLFIFLHFIPLLILIPLYALELGVAMIQSFVFAILLCIYLNDALNITH